MKISKLLSVVTLTTSIFLASCKKNEPVLKNQTNEVNYTQASSLELSNYFKNNLNNKNQSFVIDVSNPQLITGSNGTKIQFYSNSFVDASGNLITGNVNISLVEILDKSSMVLTNKPTMGRNYLGQLIPLISGGEFRILASQNGQSVRLRPGYGYSATVPTSNGITDPNMSIFYGDTNNNDTLIWNPADSSFLQSDSGAYAGYFDSIGWINCD